MNKSTVALVRCNTYDEAQVQEAIATGIDLLGGISRFVARGEKIVLKPNALLGTNPQKGVNTHPSVFRAAGSLLQQTGAIPYGGDSPAFGRCAGNLKRAGLKQPADELGIGLVDFDRGTAVTHENALLNRRFVIANGVLAADGLISLPKLKTHGLVRLTGAIKNQFGCIPGILKSQYHVKMPDPYDFATMLVDLNSLLKPRLYIMDGILAMEGNGPRSGNPKQLNALLISSDPVALDSIACKIIGLNPVFVPTSEPGERAGLGTYHDENIELLGDAVGQFIDESFDVIRKPPIPAPSGFMKTFLRNRLCPKPTIRSAACTVCGTCVKLCPVEHKAVDWHTGNESKPPTFKYERCIRCYCCQEVCPEGAVIIKDTWLGKILFR